MCKSIVFTLLVLLVSAAAGAQGCADIEIVIDGVPVLVAADDVPGDLLLDDEGGLAAIDIVGDTLGMALDWSLAKGNSYLVDEATSLLEAEFWLDFNDTQTLTFYVFTSPAEFGIYSEVYRSSRVVTGQGLGWYSSDPFYVVLNPGQHYIVAVSWTGLTGYYFGFGDSQATTFGSQTHGYAVGSDPLPTTIFSEIDDYAIYYQRLTTDIIVPAKVSSWGGVKALYR